MSLLSNAHDFVDNRLCGSEDCLLHVCPIAAPCVMCCYVHKPASNRSQKTRLIHGCSVYLYVLAIVFFLLAVVLDAWAIDIYETEGKTQVMVYRSSEIYYRIEYNGTSHEIRTTYNECSFIQLTSGLGTSSYTYHEKDLCNDVEPKIKEIYNVVLAAFILLLPTLPFYRIRPIPAVLWSGVPLILLLVGITRWDNYTRKEMPYGRWDSKNGARHGIAPTENLVHEIYGSWYTIFGELSLFDGSELDPKPLHTVQSEKLDEKVNLNSIKLSSGTFAGDSQRKHAFRADSENKDGHGLMSHPFEGKTEIDKIQKNPESNTVSLESLHNIVLKEDKLMKSQIDSATSHQDPPVSSDMKGNSRTYYNTRRRAKHVSHLFSVFAFVSAGMMGILMISIIADSKTRPISKKSRVVATHSHVQPMDGGIPMTSNMSQAPQMGPGNQHMHSIHIPQAGDLPGAMMQNHNMPNMSNMPNMPNMPNQFGFMPYGGYGPMGPMGPMGPNMPFNPMQSQQMPMMYPGSQIPPMYNPAMQFNGNFSPYPPGLQQPNQQPQPSFMNDASPPDASRA